MEMRTSYASSRSRSGREKRRTDQALIELITDDVQESRRLAVADQPQLPPAPLTELLPLMGWLIYEATWETVQRVPRRGTGRPRRRRTGSGTRPIWGTSGGG